MKVHAITLGYGMGRGVKWIFHRFARDMGYIYIYIDTTPILNYPGITTFRSMLGRAVNGPVPVRVHKSRTVNEKMESNPDSNPELVHNQFPGSEIGTINENMEPEPESAPILGLVRV